MHCSCVTTSKLSAEEVCNLPCPMQGSHRLIRQSYTMLIATDNMHTHSKALLEQPSVLNVTRKLALWAEACVT